MHHQRDSLVGGRRPLCALRNCLALNGKGLTAGKPPVYSNAPKPNLAMSSRHPLREVTIYSL